jgi:hypothetical protein
VNPKLLQWIVAVFLVTITVLVVASGGSGSAGGLDLATANDALAVAAPGAGVSISSEELEAKDFPPSETAPGAYPAAPSFAKGMTPEWHKYAAMVDRVCALSWNYMRVAKARALQQAYAERWTQTHAAARTWRLTSDEDARILQATDVLGQPPAEQVLFAKWRANVARRTTLFADAGRASAAGDFGLVQRICRKITRLKAQADELGQRFGLQICTSN